MSPRIAPAALCCQNCGFRILDDGRSPTGFLHALTERARCDGERLRNGEGHKNRHAMAVPE